MKNSNTVHIIIRVYGSGTRTGTGVPVTPKSEYRSRFDGPGPGESRAVIDHLAIRDCMNFLFIFPFCKIWNFLIEKVALLLI